jgi:hypothetical protein
LSATSASTVKGSGHFYIPTVLFYVIFFLCIICAKIDFLIFAIAIHLDFITDGLNQTPYKFMKKRFFNVGVVAAIALSLSCSSCIGSFSMFHKLSDWNNNIGQKAVNELVFFAFWVIPVYEVALAADLLVLNSIEFWSGTNPVAKGTKRIKGDNGTYLVKCDGKGYDIISETDGTSMRLDFCVDTQTWNYVDHEGKEWPLITFIDDSHVAMPTPTGESTIVEISQSGLIAYRQIAMTQHAPVAIR